MRRCLAFFLATSITACGTSLSYVPLNDAAPRAPRRPEQVEIFAAGPPARPYTETGMIEANQESDLSVDDANDILRKMREDAAERGCDALVISGADKVERRFLSDNVDNLKGYRGVCLVYTQPTLPPPGSAPPPVPTATTSR